MLVLFVRQTSQITTSLAMLFVPIVGKPSMSRGALNRFHNVSTYGKEVIDIKYFFTEFSFKSKLDFIGEFGGALVIVGKVSISRI